MEVAQGFKQVGEAVLHLRLVFHGYFLGEGLMLLD